MGWGAGRAWGGGGRGVVADVGGSPMTGLRLPAMAGRSPVTKKIGVGRGKMM
ncbi:hypothetical protein TIFTF001_027455 [Ficus carica]|uniref:Uncharacterized protein n=1 Tax=Ficus carica TaxID=3494 RepID=A0AA88DN30_FICCA|nr:hypothetical protein TIFTF001_027455 [Ficus carica]